MQSLMTESSVIAFTGNFLSSLPSPAIAVGEAGEVAALSVSPSHLSCTLRAEGWGAGEEWLPAWSLESRAPTDRLWAEPAPRLCRQD